MTASNSGCVGKQEHWDHNKPLKGWLWKLGVHGFGGTEEQRTVVGWSSQFIFHTTSTLLAHSRAWGYFSMLEHGLRMHRAPGFNPRQKWWGGEACFLPGGEK